MKALFTLIPDNLIQALGWTLFHSLWQGMVIGLVLMLVFRYRRNLSPQGKYLMGVLALAAMLGSSIFSFILFHQPVPPSTAINHHSSGPLSMPDRVSANGDAFTLFSGWRELLTGTFDIVSLIWFLGVLLLTARMAGGLWIIQGLRRQQVSALPADWERRLRQLARKTGLRRSITFLQSERASIPTVVGLLKPTILIPAMILSGFPANQLEAIMVHELAHIRRHDFLINILQSVTEAILFYHPVVWIISEQVRQEREKCCDDLTVRVCGQVSLYARALARLGEYQITATTPSVAIAGNKKNLVTRVERLINKQKMKINRTERMMAAGILTASVLIITLGTGASLQPAGFIQLESKIFPSMNQPDDPPSAPEPFEEPVADASLVHPATPAEPVAPVQEAVPVTPKAREAAPALPKLPVEMDPLPVILPDTSHRHDQNKLEVKDNLVTREIHTKKGEDLEMKFVIRQGKVKELYVDGKKIPQNEYSKYQKEIDTTLDELRDMEQDLKEAREELEEMDFDEIREELEFEMQHFREHEMKEIEEELQQLREEQFDIQIDREEIQREIEEAMKRLEQIDFTKIEKEIQAAMSKMKLHKADVEKEKRNMDEMIEELEKLELDRK